MDKTFLEKMVVTSPSKTVIANKLREALKVKKVEAPSQECIEIDEAENISENYNWLDQKLKNGIQIVNISVADYYAASLNNIVGLLRETLPLDVRFIGSLVWVEKDSFDTFIQMIGERYGIRIYNTNDGKNSPIVYGTTWDYYPNQITRYILLSEHNIL